MKRFVLLTGAAALAALALPGEAQAEPGILYIPTETVTLTPSAECPVAQGGQANSGLGCGGVTATSDIAPYEGDVDALVDGLRAALEAYDVMVTTTRPPAYVPYFMLMATNMTSDKSFDYDCVGAGIGCGGRARNDISFTNGGTMNCMNPDPIHAALYAFGRMSGLEGTDDATGGAMAYPVDYTTPATDYSSTCANRVQQVFYDEETMMDMMSQLECTSVDHEAAECEMGQQNSQADLMAWYGARTTDTDPPELSNIVPEDGAVLDSGAQVLMDADIADASGFANVRWILSSPALEAAGVEGGILDYCTNNACAGGGWEKAGPLWPVDTDWAFSVNGPPDGEYTITLEAADMHGNVAEIVTRTITVGDGSGDGGDDGADSADAGDGMSDGADSADSGMFTDGGMDDESGDGGDGGGDGGDGGGGGCKIDASPTNGAFGLLLIALFALGLRTKDDE